MSLTAPRVSASYFGSILGLAGLAGAWRAADRAWDLPAFVGELIFGLSGLVWAVLVILYALKRIFDRNASIEEARHPVQCCFIGLVGVATMLVAQGLLPYSGASATVPFWLGGTYTIMFASWRTGGLWQGGRDEATTTPVLYLPTVAGLFVSASTAAALEYRDFARLAFGAGFFSWLAIESVLLWRLITTLTLAPTLRPNRGIQLAPPVVGAVAWLSINGSQPDAVSYAFLWYGILLALLLARLLPWLLEQPFGPSYWAFTFGVTALAIEPLRLTLHGESRLIEIIAAITFIGANIVVGSIGVPTVRAFLRSRLHSSGDHSRRSGEIGALNPLAPSTAGQPLSGKAGAGERDN